MNKYFKEFCLRGLIFSGFGPIITGIVLFCVSLKTELFLGGKEILAAIISTYLLAFVHAGASVFNQIESWSIPKSAGIHFLMLYLAYVSCYLVNSWIPFNINVILIFTAIFAVVYAVIWITVFLIVRKTTKKLNRKIKQS